MLGLSFLHPGLLWGLALGAVPIIIHLLNRRRFRRTPWAAMEFLLAALRRNRRRLWMEELLLLLLRVAAAVLLVLLVARPLSSGAGLLATLAGDRGIHHLVVLDDSASMAQARGGRTLLDRAGATVEELLEGLLTRRSGDLLTLVLGSAPDRPLLDARPLSRESVDLAASLLAKGRPTGTRLAPADLLKRFAANLGELAGPEGRRVALYLASDFRRTDWTGPGDRTLDGLNRTLSRLARAEVRTTLIALPGATRGLGVVGLEPVGSLIVAGVPIELEVTLRNQGLTQLAPVRPQVTAGGRTRPLKPTPSLAPGQETRQRFRVMLPRPGFHAVTVEVAGDDLPADNRRHLVLSLSESARILVVAEQGEEGREGPAFYLASALSPGEVASGYTTDPCAPAEAASRDLDAYDAVILAGLSAPHPELTRKLAPFVESGGGLLLFAGPDLVPPAWNKSLGDLLPYPMGEPADRREEPLAAALAPGPAALFARAPDLFGGWLAGSAFRGYTTPGGPLRPGVEVAATLRDEAGSPLFACARKGRGRILFSAVSADASWSAWVGDPFFPLFLQEAAGWALRPYPAARWNQDCGQPITCELDLSTDKGVANLLVPGSAAPLPRRADQGRIHHDDTRTAGVYEIGIPRSDGSGKRLELRACNVPGAECRLETLTAGAMENLYPEAALRWVPEGEIGQVANAGDLDPSWRVVAALLLLVLLGETVLGRRIARGRVF